MCLSLSQYKISTCYHTVGDHVSDSEINSVTLYSKELFNYTVFNAIIAKLTTNNN
jgi:hypothetical protein